MTATPSTLDRAIIEAVRGAQRVMVLSGAGMSAESGVPTFRDAQTGLWEDFDPADLATPGAWHHDPEFVWAWYAWRVGLVRGVEPNAGHLALTDLAGLRETIIATQNIDDLHERAGSTVLAHLHGSLFAFRCSACHAPYHGPIEVPDEPVERLAPPRCEVCGERVRPGVVWYGEDLPLAEFDATVAAIETLEPGDVALVIGTSGVVFPAAGLPAMALAEGATVIEINPQETEISDMAHLHVRAPVAVALPQLVAALRD